jgi:hypothetical protein
MDYKYECVISYLHDGVYPAFCDKDAKRRIRERASSFRVVKDQLYHVGRGSKLTEVVTDEKHQHAIISEMHSGIVGGCHYGQTAMINKVCDRFWWPSVVDNVRAHFQGCIFSIALLIFQL